MADVHDSTEVEEYRPNWVLRSIYIALLAANAYLVFDWWAQTPQGEAFVGRVRARVEAAQAKAKECEGCARRRAWLKAQTNRMHFQAIQIVEGEDVPTQPEAPA